jgi:hypothetical protein
MTDEPETVETKDSTEQTDVVWYWAVSLLDDIDPPLWRVAP